MPTMTSKISKLRQVLITTEKVVNRREKVVGSIQLQRSNDWSTTIPCELEISWVITSLGANTTEEKYAGIRLQMKTDNCEGAQDCYIDVNDIQDFLDGIDTVFSHEDQISQCVSEARHVYYACKEDARVGIDKLAGVPNVRKYFSLAPHEEVYLFTSEDSTYRYKSPALIPVSSHSFDPIWKLISSALHKLQENLKN